MARLLPLRHPKTALLPEAALLLAIDGTAALASRAARAVPRSRRVRRRCCLSHATRDRALRDNALVAATVLAKRFLMSAIKHQRHNKAVLQHVAARR